MLDNALLSAKPSIEQEQVPERLETGLWGMPKIVVSPD